ncbi:MAG TPA: HupE/UreJ family protein [Thermoanaerobaculia bacterium]|nr:HupE/UreJ family protein [Thermoanaerobaculia bacterium]
MRRILLPILLICASSALAHEIGTTQVRVELRRNHTYRIDVVTAPQALLNKLEARAGTTRTRGLDANALRASLLRFAPELLRAADIRFGAQSSIPRVEILPIVVPRDPSTPQHVVLRYSGEVPQRAGAFAWSWDLVYSTYALTIQTPHGAKQQWIEGGDRSEPFPVATSLASPATFDVLRQYLLLGFTHIVPLGLDHILFVIGMFLLTPRVKAVLTQVTAFTIAHTITLALTMYGVLAISPRVVEPLIALSIAYVAVENLTTSQLRPWRVAIVFAFGLLHGMGFAGVLQELGLPRSQAAYALISFNIGVELGQLAVILAIYAALVSWTKQRSWFRPRVVVPASLAIAAMGVFWTIQRIAQ